MVIIESDTVLKKYYITRYKST